METKNRSKRLQNREERSQTNAVRKSKIEKERKRERHRETERDRERER